MPHVFYAKVFGIFLLLIALGILFNMDQARRTADQMINGPTGYIMGGILPTLVGVWMVVEHNIWHAGWPLVITLIGWVLLLLGVFRLWFVKAWHGVLTRHHTKAPILFALFGLIIGLLLCYVGFVSPRWLTTALMHTTAVLT